MTPHRIGHPGVFARGVEAGPPGPKRQRPPGFRGWPIAERELMVERTQAVLQAARKQGRVGGRRLIMTNAAIHSARKLPDQGTPRREVAETAL